VLDVGAGKGYWRTWLAHALPSVHYHGIDASEHACRRYGHELADLATWQPPREFDLVVCQSVLQYLPDDAAALAIGTLGRACGRLMYLEVPTAWDRDEIFDSERTDMDIHWRTGDWYRSRLDEHFVEIGAALWARRDAALFFELEAVPRRDAV
jgi:trans-aconitate methyltransferase